MSGASVSGSASVSERLVGFMRGWRTKGLPEPVLHETKRLVLNQFKASVGATDHAAIRILHDWASAAAAPEPAAQVLWFGSRATPQNAAVVNGALFEVLDFHDTYIPTFMHAVSGVLPAVLALAEARGSSGRQFLTALALGLEVELAVATILMPTGYYRGFVPAGLVGGVGAAAACAALCELDDERTRNAIGLAMCTAFGTYESVGSMALAYITGATARSGLTAFELAERGLDAPRTAFEGEKGMLASYSNESADKIDGVLTAMPAADANGVVAGAGADAARVGGNAAAGMNGATAADVSSAGAADVNGAGVADVGGNVVANRGAAVAAPWRIFGQTYKTVPTETITHGPIECVLALRPRAGDRVVERMRFGVEAIVVKIVKERMERFGNPSSELTARFDLCHCAAATWVRGRFGLDEMREPCYTDPAVLDLRSRIELVADPARKTFEGAGLTVTYTDGSTDSFDVPNFLGTPGRPMSDAQLAEVFIAASAGLLPDGRAEQIAAAVRALDAAPDLRALLALTRLH